MVKTVYYFSMYFLFASVFLNEIFNLDRSRYTISTSFGVLLFLVSSLTLIRGFQLYVSLISLAIGHLIFLNYNLGYDIWYSSITKSIGMPILFVVIPLITFPIKHGQYLEAVESFLGAKREKPIFLFIILAIIHLFLTITLNIASIPTMQNILDKIKLPHKFLSRLYTTGYSSYMVFSPYDGVVNMVLIFTSVRYSEYFFSGLSMVLVITIISAGLLKTDLNQMRDLNHSLSILKENVVNKRVYELLFHILMLIGIAFLGDKLLHFSNPLYGIAIIIVVYSIFWGFLLKKLSNFKEELADYSKNLLNYKGFLPFLISASFLGSMVSYTPLKDNIGGVLLSFNSLPSYFIIQFFILLTMSLSLCGVNMMISVTTLALTISPDILGLSNIAFALTLLTSWFMAMSISPFVPFAVVVAESIKDKPLNVTLKNNLKFCFLMLFVAPIVILLINSFTR
ncbi:MAG: hypothetical protein M0T74_11125 [Desulfitobacterium hafniense]|nr:hypothetical protein [Desulfitobacterium hafniense]